MMTMRMKTKAELLQDQYDDVIRQIDKIRSRPTFVGLTGADLERWGRLVNLRDRLLGQMQYEAGRLS